MLTFTKEQLSEVMCKHAEKENGLHDLLEIMLESLMVAERGEFLREQEDRNKGNGYRLGHTYGHGTLPSSLEHPFAPQEAYALGGHHHCLAG